MYKLEYMYIFNLILQIFFVWKKNVAYFSQIICYFLKV